MHIWTLIKSGLQSLLFGKRPNKQFEEPTKMESEMDSPTGTLKIHKLIAGPYHSLDDPDLEDEGDFWWIECMVEFDGHLEDMTLAHDDFNKIYEIVAHLKSPTVEPFIIGGGSHD